MRILGRFFLFIASLSFLFLFSSSKVSAVFCGDSSFPTCDGTCAVSGQRCLINWNTDSCFCAFPASTWTPTPQNTRPPTATPTLACEPNDNNICNNGAGYCGFTCDGTDCNNTGTKTVSCYTSYSCVLTDDYCSRISGIWDTGNCPIYNTCTCSSLYSDSATCNADASCYWNYGTNTCLTRIIASPSPILTQGPTPTTYCQPYQCQNVGAGNYCTIGGDPNFLIGGCSSASRCDNCRGTACEWCPGTTPVPQPTTTTPCLESCTSDPRYLTTCSNTTFTICSGTQSCYGAVGANCGSECSNYATGTTYTSPNGCGTCSGCNSFPSIPSGSLVIKNSAGTVVGGESGGSTSRNHICQTTFQDTALPRRVRFEVTATDLNGGDTISSGTLTWRTRNYPLSVLSVSGNNAVLYANVDFLTADNSTAVGDIYVTVNDSSGGTSGQVDTQRDFKVWNCNITASGRIYDGSAVGSPVCTTALGYTTPVDGDFNFRSLRFNRTDNSAKVNTSVTLPSQYTSVPNYLIWGRSFNNLTTDWNYNSGDGELAGTTPLMRVSGGSIAGYRCGPVDLRDSSMIDPYSSTTSLTVDYSSVLNQEAWWQVDGSGVRTNSTLTDSVPVTCAVSGTCTAAVSKDDATLGNDNGLVSATSIDNNSGCGSSCTVGDPDDRYYEGGILNESFTYDKLKSDYYDTYSEGRILNDGGDYWATIKADVTNKVIFVNGNLSINSNRTLAANSFSMVVVSGTITIDPSVTRVDGIYMADNGISIAGDNATQLVIQGMLHSSSGNISITRSYTSGAANNTSPAVLIKYRPDMIFNMPVNLSRALSNWRGGI